MGPNEPSTWSGFGQENLLDVFIPVPHAVETARTLPNGVENQVLVLRLALASTSGLVPATVPAHRDRERQNGGFLKKVAHSAAFFRCAVGRVDRRAHDSTLGVCWNSNFVLARHELKGQRLREFDLLEQKS